MAGFGFILLILAFFGFITGIIMVFFSKIRKSGQITLLVSLIVLIIGVSICSISPSPFGNNYQEMERACYSGVSEWESTLKDELKSSKFKKEFYSIIKDLRSNKNISNFKTTNKKDLELINLFSKKIEVLFENKRLNTRRTFTSVPFNYLKNEKWTNEVISSFKLVEKTFYIQGMISSDSSMVYYSGFLDFNENKFYLDENNYSKTYISFEESAYECIESNYDKNYLNMKSLNLKERKEYFTLKMTDSQKLLSYFKNKEGLKVKIIMNEREIPVFAFKENYSSKFHLKPYLEL